MTKHPLQHTNCLLCNKQADCCAHDNTYGMPLDGTNGWLRYSCFHCKFMWEQDNQHGWLRYSCFHCKFMWEQDNQQGLVWYMYLYTTPPQHRQGEKIDIPQGTLPVFKSIPL